MVQGICPGPPGPSSFSPFAPREWIRPKNRRCTTCAASCAKGGSSCVGGTSGGSSTAGGRAGRRGTTQSRREANARHQASPEGRADHRAHQRAYARRRRAAQRRMVTDTGLEKLAPVVDLMVSSDPETPQVGERAVGDRRLTDGAISIGRGALEEVDPPSADPRPRRDLSGVVATIDVEIPGASVADDDRGAGAMGGHSDPRCAVCGRPGRVVLPRSHRRAGMRDSELVLRGRRWWSAESAGGEARGSGASVTSRTCASCIW